MPRGFAISTGVSAQPASRDGGKEKGGLPEGNGQASSRRGGPGREGTGKRAASDDKVPQRPREMNHPLGQPAPYLGVGAGTSDDARLRRPNPGVPNPGVVPIARRLARLGSAKTAACLNRAIDGGRWRPIARSASSGLFHGLQARVHSAAEVSGRSPFDGRCAPAAQPSVAISPLLSKSVTAGARSSQVFSATHCGPWPGPLNVEC